MNEWFDFNNWILRLTDQVIGFSFNTVWPLLQHKLILMTVTISVCAHLEKSLPNYKRGLAFNKRLQILIFYNVLIGIGMALGHLAAVPKTLQ